MGEITLLEMIPQVVKMVPQPSEIIPQAAEIVPQAAEMTQQHWLSISAIDDLFICINT